MLSKIEIDELNEALEQSQSPLFFFDNDVDGLCSFLLLSRFINKGKGVPVRSFPDLHESYFRKVNELHPDAIFILDKPKVSSEFIERVHERGLPIFWIDHHLTDDEIPDYVHYYNPLLQKSPSAEPTTRLCYQITQNKKDLWIAAIGCLADNYFPEFYAELMKQYSDLCIQSTSAFEIVYRSELGKLVRLLNFALKDTTTNVVRMLKFLRKVQSPVDVLQVNVQTHSIHKRFEQINNKYHKLLSKAINIGANSKDMLYFQYGGDLSVSADLANELSYRFPDKIIVIAYVKNAGGTANVSLRGKDVRELTLKAIEGIELATGGGHIDATGARVPVDSISQFKKNLKKLIEERQKL